MRQYVSIKSQQTNYFTPKIASFTKSPSRQKEIFCSILCPRISAAPVVDTNRTKLGIVAVTTVRKRFNQHKEHIVDTRFLPPDGVWVRRVANGWHVVSRNDEDDSVREAVYEDPPIAIGALSNGVDSSSSRSLHSVLWDHFESYMQSKYRAGLVISMRPASSLEDKAC